MAIHRMCRGFAALLAIVVLAGSSIETTFAGFCAVDPGCYCCLEDTCDGYHDTICPTDHHDCRHHTGTACNWDVTVED
jgi:hypothetical protein